MAIEVDNLFQALDIILDQRLAKINYDKTDICIITDASDAKNGRYWVSPNNGETRYEAYSESEEYKKGENVRVSILNGDYTQKKFIVGKYVVDDAITPITYISPLDTVIDVTGNMISETKSIAQYGLISNGEVTEIPIWSADLALDQSYRDLQASGIYNTISLSAQFKTLLDNYDMRSGSFGLRLDIYTKLNPSSEKYIVRSVYMDSSEMFGNPYAFVLYTPQSRKYDLSKLGAVEKMSLWFYQKGDFSYYNTAEHKTVNIDYKKIPRDNILIKNIKVGFGSDLNVIQDNTIQAYTTNSPNYRLIVTEADNEKQLGFLWYNKDENNQYLGYSDGIVDIKHDKDNNIVYINKLDKNWNKVTTDVLDENGKPILEFAKDTSNRVIIVSELDNDGKEKPITNTVQEALNELFLEINNLNNELTAEYENKNITLEEYTARRSDIQDYENIKSTYLNTQYHDEAREALVEEERQVALEAARVELAAGNLSNNQYLNLVDDINTLYDNKLDEIYNYRVEKTYVLQNKQQDVMVPEVIPYDEFKYMEESEIDARLTAQTGKENIPSDANSLKLAADLAEIKPIMAKTFDLVTKDLVAALRQMRDRTRSIDDIAEKLNNLLMTPTKDAAGQIKSEERNNIRAWYDSADKLRTKMYNIYTQLLEYNYLCQVNLKKLPAEQEPVTPGEDLNAWDQTALYQAIKTSFEDVLIKMVNNFFDEAQSIIDSAYSGYQAIYDTYKNKANRIINQIRENLQKMEKITGKDQNVDPNGNHAVMLKLRPYNPDYTYIEYKKKDLSNYDNRYAIYWYRYEPGYISDDRLCPTEWKRLTTKADFGIDKNSAELVYNYGLPIYDDFTLKDGNYYFADKVQATNTIVTRIMDGQRTEEKYKVVLFYNHEMYVSNEVVFTNLDDVVDPTTADKNDAIVITHGANSQDTYQNYGMNNFLLNIADASKVRNIEVHYEGLLAGDEALAGAQVYWYIPNTATMLTCDDKYLTETLGFSSDKNIADDKKPDYSRNGYTCYYKTISSETVPITDNPETKEIESGEMITAKVSDLAFTYKIKDYYLSTASRNEILCKIIKNEYSFETSILFAFTSFGTSGTDYTLAITPATSQIAVYPAQALPLDIVLYDYNNQQIPIGETLLAENGASNFKLEWEGPTSYGAAESYGVDDSVVGANISLVVEPSEDDSLIYGVLKASAICPIQYTTNAEADSQEDEENANKASTRNVNLISYYPIPYSAGNYYIEGATTIIYDSMGSNPTYYKDPYKIFTCNTNENLAEKKIVRNGVVSDRLKYDVLWRIAYYKKDRNGKTIKLNKDIHKDYNICRNYMPTLNEKGGLNVSNMYINNMDCWCAVECWIKDLETATHDTKYSLIWVQPIFILQNRYPSSMLNSWDGSLTIDKKNGTILSSLMGAGRKTRNNTFEGVLMGDIEGSAGIVNAGNKSGLGIYGFNDGAQSFGFNVDGTGFIGKSGRGRILFNGNEGKIQSASYVDSSHEDPFGMQIDFDDGYIDMRGGIEYTDVDWVNLILSKYAKILNAKKEVLNEAGKVVESSEYVISPQVITLSIQRALLGKIREDAFNLPGIYTYGQNIVDTLWNNGSLTFDERTAIVNELTAKYYWAGDNNAFNGELKYYAMDTLKLMKLKGGFDFEGETYEINLKQYNTILNELDEYILIETYDGQYNKDSNEVPINYKNRYGTLSRALINENTNAEEKAQSHIRLDVKSPYFDIISQVGKNILRIAKDEYFLQSDNCNLLNAGMKIDLMNGKIWAANFELNAWNNIDQKGLYLNSNPNSNEYYLKLGDLDNSYITYDANGNVQMRVNSFELTGGSLGGKNLLNNTTPNIVSGTLKYWNAGSGTLQQISVGNQQYAIQYTGNEFYQDGIILENKKYILSGEIYASSSTTINISLKTKSIALKLNTGWNKISQIFDLNGVTGLNRLRIYNINVLTQYYHLKLEEGTVATAWSLSEQDVIDGYTAKVDELNNQLDQDAIFNKLTKNGTAKGIYLKDQQLYINATYMATGILRSTNWNGTFNEIKQDDGSYIYTINTTPTQGMYINLNDGNIWAAKFTLLTNNIYFSDTSKQFTINGVNQSVVLRMGNNFGVSADGTLYATGANISGTIETDNITATNGTIGNWKISNGNLISNNGSVTLNGSSGTISGSTISGGSISGANISGGSININNQQFYVGSDGNAIIHGAITANSGSIGNWKIGFFGIYLPLNSNDTESSSQYYWGLPQIMYMQNGSALAQNQQVTLRVGDDDFYVTSTGLLFAKNMQIGASLSIPKGSEGPINLGMSTFEASTGGVELALKKIAVHGSKNWVLGATKEVPIGSTTLQFINGIFIGTIS